jgi:broad specificity phosphatase PhoE
MRGIIQRRMGSRVLSQVGCVAFGVLVILLGTTPGSAAGGSDEAWALGEAFRSHGVRVDRILSSPWCRCLETARLMAVGPVESSWALVPDTESGVSVRLAELKQIVAAWQGPGTLVLVTHALTARALLGFLPIQGEAVVLRPRSGGAAGGELVGLIAAPE